MLSKKNVILVIKDLYEADVSNSKPLDRKMSWGVKVCLQ